VTVSTSAAAMALALQCVPPSLAPIAAGIALQENPKLDLQAVNHNVNGTFDYGLAQINSANFAWLSQSMRTPVNERTIFDPCINLQAAMRVLFARYNGNPTDAVKAAYAAGVMAKIPTGAEAPPRQPETNETPPPAWDMEAVAEWRRRYAPTAEDAAEAPPPPAIAEPVNEGANR
jgi:hypothetical protein